MVAGKILWQGKVLSIQPRIRLTRSYDQRFHNYLGYVLRIDGHVADEQREFLIGIGKGAHAKHQLHAGHELRGLCEAAADHRVEPADFYKVSRLQITGGSPQKSGDPPPWLGIPPELTVYRERGHRRLDARTYSARCTTCIWGCRMAVEMIIDQWKPDKNAYTAPI